MTSRILLPVAFLLVCCNSQPNHSSDISSDTTKNASDSTTIEKPYAESFTNRLWFTGNKHRFSDTVEADSFRLELFGDSILNGTIIFSIVDAGRRRIYSDTFPAWDLLGDMSEVIPKDEAKVDTIKQRFFNFFTETNFIYPAIKPTDTLEVDNPWATIWEHIKSNPTAIGFGFYHGYEGYYEIAYDPIEKHVECYYSSD